MKKITTTIIAPLIVALFFTQSQAQTDHVAVEGRSLFPIGETYDGNPATQRASQKLMLSEVSAKAVRSFKNYFSHSESPAWYAANGQYLAKFNDGSRPTSALFTKDGRLVYAVSYGIEKDLPRDIKRIVNTAYEDHKIGAVTEVHAMQQHAWIVNLESYGRVVIVRYMDGQLDELKSYTRN